MRGKKVRILLALVTAAVLFGGCGVKKAQEAAAEDAAARAETTAAPETPEETVEATETPTPEVKTVKMYTLANVALRESEEKGAPVLKKLAVNTKVTVLEKGDKKHYVRVKGQEGYVLAKMLTEKKKEAVAAEKLLQEAEAAALAEMEAAQQKAAEEEAAKQAEEAAAKEAEEAARIAEEEAAAQGGDTISEVDDSGAEAEPWEEYFDDCDGSGHGYKIIHYPDGTEEKVEY